MPSHSPYAVLGLWRNPFGELTQTERSELAVLDVREMVRFLKASSWAAIQLIGGCGFGKTTHLLALCRELPGAALVYFPEDGPRPRLPGSRPLLVDEGQRMGWWRRRELLASPGPIVVATHTDLSRPIQRAGFRLMTVDVQRAKSPQELATILNRRIEASRLRVRAGAPCPALPAVVPQFAEQLLQRFGSNLRAIENYLYDDLQQCVSEKQQWPHAI